MFEYSKREKYTYQFILFEKKECFDYYIEGISERK